MCSPYIHKELRYTFRKNNLVLLLDLAQNSHDFFAAVCTVLIGVGMGSIRVSGPTISTKQCG